MPSTVDSRDIAVRRVRRAHLVSVAAGVLVIVLASLSLVTRPMPCGDLPSTYPPIIAFELARSGKDLDAIFGADHGSCHRSMISRMDTANHVDLALFIPAYTIFIGAAFVGLRRRGRPLATAGIAFAVLAAAADLVENACLLGLTPALDPTSRWMAILPWATGVKWLALGGAGAAAAGALWPGERRHHQVSAAVCVLTPIATIAAVADPHVFGQVVGSGVAASWIVLLVDGVAQIRRRARV